MYKAVIVFQPLFQVKGRNAMEVIDYGRQNEGLMDFDFLDRHSLCEHAHMDIEVFFCLEGSLTLMVERSRFELEKDDIVVIDSNKIHSYKSAGEVLAGVLHINYFKAEEYMDTENYYFQCNSVTDQNKGYAEIRKTLNSIFRLYFDKTKEKIRLNSLYFELLHIMTKNFMFQREFSAGKKLSEEEKRVREIERYVKENFRCPITLNEMANHFYLTSSYLSKFITKYMGMNFMSYLNEIRLKSAVEDMKTFGRTISQAALNSGFPNTASFLRAFKKEYGVLPSVWIKQYRQKSASNIVSRTDSQKKERAIKKYLTKTAERTSETSVKSAESILTADANKFGVYNKNWNEMINIGSVSGLLNSELRQDLLTLKQELGFSYVRFWDIFSESMLIDLRISKKNHNFKRLDSALDFAISSGLHPFIELGFKPFQLLRTVDNTIIERKRDFPFKNIAEFASLLHEFMAHCVNRYGISEVEKWYFEQWCDPRLCENDSFDRYFLLFETEYGVIKSVSPRIKLGGAGFGRLYGKLEFQDIINLWKKRIVYPDYISIYCYPYAAKRGKGSPNEDRTRDPDFMRNQFQTMRDILDKASMRMKEIIISEWSSSVSDWNSLNDSVYKGAFILRSIINNIGAADMMGYWLASDVLTEYYDTGMPLHGGNGLLSADGIRKPAFYAMRFAGMMYDRLLAKDSHSVITSNGCGNYNIICHNYINPNFRYYLKNEDEAAPEKHSLLFDEAAPLKLSFRINGVRSGKYLIKIFSVNKSNGSVLDKWGELKYIKNPDRQDIQYLKDISTPKITIEELQPENGSLTVTTVLAPLEIQSIQILYQIVDRE